MPMEDGCEVRHCIACAQVFRGKGQNARFLNPNARFLILNPRNRQWCVRAHARPRNCSGIDGGSGEAAAAAGVCRSARRAARAWRSLNGSARLALPGQQPRRSTSLVQHVRRPCGYAGGVGGSGLQRNRGCEQEHRRSIGSVFLPSQHGPRQKALVISQGLVRGCDCMSQCSMEEMGIEKV